VSGIRDTEAITGTAKTQVASTVAASILLQRYLATVLMSVPFGISVEIFMPASVDS
jgi:hypothetical protein